MRSPQRRKRRHGRQTEPSGRLCALGPWLGHDRAALLR